MCGGDNACGMLRIVPLFRIDGCTRKCLLIRLSPVPCLLMPCSEAICNNAKWLKYVILLFKRTFIHIARRWHYLCEIYDLFEEVDLVLVFCDMISIVLTLKQRGTVETMVFSLAYFA